MLINLSNHPYAQWGEEQRLATEMFGECIDLPFPAIDPEGDEEYISRLSEDYLQKILKLTANFPKKEITIHLMGEMTFVFNLLKKLEMVNIRCIASTTVRKETEFGNDKKETQFNFVRFRYYY